MSIQDAADQVRGLVNQHRALIAIGDALDKIGSFEQAEREALAARDKAVAERETALHALSDVAAQIGNARALAEKAQQDADAIVDGANIRASMALAEAKDAAAATIAQAESDAKQIAVQTQAASQTLLETLQKVGVARGELADLTAKVAGVKAELSKFIN